MYRMGMTAAEDIVRVFRGEPPVNIANRPVRYRREPSSICPLMESQPSNHRILRRLLRSKRPRRMFQGAAGASWNVLRVPASRRLRKLRAGELASVTRQGSPTVARFR